MGSQILLKLLLVGSLHYRTFIDNVYSYFLSYMKIILKLILLGSFHFLFLIDSVGDYFLSFTEIVLKSVLVGSLHILNFIYSVFNFSLVLPHTITIMGLFYLLFAVCVVTACNVVSSGNPLHCLLNLVLLVFVGSLHLLTLGVDFLAFAFIIVYVGALAVLFLFVVIMLNIKANAYKFKTEVFLILAFSLGLLFLATHDLDSSYTTLDICAKKLRYEKYGFGPVDFLKHVDQITSIKALGFALYTKYLIHFVLCGLILLVAIIGAIVLTSKNRLDKTKVSENAVNIRNNISSGMTIKKKI